MPCILQTKKRYIGYMYESLDQKEPVFDAKGIETVRRDSCAAVSKVGIFLLFTKGYSTHYMISNIFPSCPQHVCSKFLIMSLNRAIAQYFRMTLITQQII